MRGATWTRAIVPAVGLAALASACASADQLRVPDVTGCYYFEQDAVARELRLPWGIRLGDQPLEGWGEMHEEARVAETLTGTRVTDAPFGYWRPAGGDSLVVGYPSGGGMILSVAREDDYLVGVVRAMGDAMPPPGVVAEPRARPVRLLFAQCPEGSQP